MANDQVFLVSRRRTLSLSPSRSLLLSLTLALSPASASVTVAIENLREKVLGGFFSCWGSALGGTLTPGKQKQKLHHHCKIILNIKENNLFSQQNTCVCF